MRNAHRHIDRFLNRDFDILQSLAFFVDLFLPCSKHAYAIVSVRVLFVLPTLCSSFIKSICCIPNDKHSEKGPRRFIQLASVLGNVPFFCELMQWFCVDLFIFCLHTNDLRRINFANLLPSIEPNLQRISWMVDKRIQFICQYLVEC